MPASKATQATEDLREEIATLRKEFAEMMELVKDKGGSYAEDISETVEKSAEAVYEKGNLGLEEINERVRKNPVASLAIAFGVGYIISKLFSSDK